MIALSAMGCSSPRQRRLNLAGDFNPFQSPDGRQGFNSDVFKRR
jgi:hypothetical protein